MVEKENIRKTVSCGGKMESGRTEVLQIYVFFLAPLCTDVSSLHVTVV